MEMKKTKAGPALMRFTMKDYEEKETMKNSNIFIKYMESMGVKFIDCTPKEKKDGKRQKKN